MSFLKELENLRRRTPRIALINVDSVNSDYCNHADKNKNCYLVHAANFNEDCLYGVWMMNSKNCIDCMNAYFSELCYECSDIEKCYDCQNLYDSKNSYECSYGHDLIGCGNCLLCASLRQKQFHILNKPYGKAEFYKKRAEILSQWKEKYIQQWQDLQFRMPHVFSRQLNAENCTGNFIRNSKNSFYVFNVNNLEDCMYCENGLNAKDMCDCMFFDDNTELCYEVYSNMGAYNCNFCSYIRYCKDCEYCELCFNCKNCFGCIGLSQAKYFILNKRYSPDEYSKCMREIKSEMLAKGDYGKMLETTYRFEDTRAYEDF